MAFLNFTKKGEELPSDIDLDVPPEPPGMLKEEISTEGAIDEELMPLRKSKPAKKREIKKLRKEFPRAPIGDRNFLTLPPKEAEELPSLSEGNLELPPPPAPLKIKKKLFSFFKPKEAAEKLPLPDVGEEFPEMPPLPGEGEEFPEMPPLSGEELPPLPEEVPVVPPLEISAPLPEAVPKPLKPVPKQEVIAEKPIKEEKFVTIGDFKQIQGDISSMEGILKGTEGFFVRLEEIKGVGDKGYTELCNNLQDIQKKIMFVDKTLFKEV